MEDSFLDSAYEERTELPYTHEDIFDNFDDDYEDRVEEDSSYYD